MAFGVLLLGAQKIVLVCLGSMNACVYVGGGGGKRGAVLLRQLNKFISHITVSALRV